MTHSYTIQPTISIDRNLLTPLFICLQEEKREFGQQVIQRLLKPENVYVSCSSSGKMTKKLVKEWYRNALLPSVEEKCVLLLDSWTGHKD